MKFFSLLITFAWVVLTAAGLGAQDGYHIEVEIDGFEGSQLFLGYHFGDKQYLRDTVAVNDRGAFVFSGEEELPGGVYLVVLPPDNRYIQLLINPGEQHFRVKTQYENTTEQLEVEGSPANERFYEYVKFLGERTPRAGELREAIEAETNDKKKEKLEKELNTLNDEVLAYQRRLVREHPGSLTAAMIRLNLPMDYPEFSGPEQEQQVQRWRYTQAHFFDNVDLADPRLLRTPGIFDRIDYYVNKLQVQHPDTISQAIDEVLRRAKPAEETFKFYLIHFLNEYAKSKVVGMDAVYVHLVENYYAKGLAPWTDEEQLAKIIENANALKPLLIGKTAPNIRLQKRDGAPVSLHEVDAPYTVLYFWRYDCGHCKKSTPKLKEFYETYKDKGVEIMAVCFKFTDEVPECWEYIDENEIGDWLHTVDPYHRSNFGKIYNIKSTPQLYVLDRDKTIISKRIGAEQLPEVIDHFLEQDKQEGGASDTGKDDK